MTAPECPREQDVINAIVAGRWSNHESLQAHARDCQICKEIVEVTTLVHVDREGLELEGNVPSAGQVWWRAAIRARLEASQQAARPLSWLFGVSVACAAGLSVAFVEFLWSPLQQAIGATSPVPWMAWFRLEEFTRLIPSIAALSPLSSISAFVLLGAAACLMLAPVALYFALSDD